MVKAVVAVSFVLMYMIFIKTFLMCICYCRQAIIDAFERQLDKYH